MPQFSWAQAVLVAAASLVSATQSTLSSSPADGLGLTVSASSTAREIASYTVSGSTITYAVPATVAADADNGPNLLPNVDDPSAKQAQSLCPGYRAADIEHTHHGFKATLNLDGEPCNVYGTDLETLSFELFAPADHTLRLSIQPANLDASNRSQYILADNILPVAHTANESWASHSQWHGADLRFNWTNDPTFAFTISRRSTGDVLFDTSGSVLVYENQFLEFVTQLPENYNLYGMGEHIHELRLGDNFTATFYAADAGTPLDYNIYGVHPFYLDTRYYELDAATGQRTLVSGQSVTADGNYTGVSHGVFLRNAHAMEALMRPTNLTWRALGGDIDLTFYDGPTPNAVTQQYLSNTIGFPALQQYWAFGFHQCRWGYANWSVVEDVVNTYRAFDIPLETIWTDIDWMYQYRDFVNDPIRYGYAEGQEFLGRLHANGQHYVPIVDSALYIPNPHNGSDNYSIYTDGHDRDVFMKNPDGSEYIGAVWPGYTVFPDWHAEQAVAWWTDSLAAHHKDIPWDGIWIDMSEVSSFCVGSCGSGNLTQNPVHPPFLLPGQPGNEVLGYPEGFNITNATEAAAASSRMSSQAALTAQSTSTTMPFFTPPPVTAGVRDVNQPPYVIKNVNGDLAVHAVSPNATHVDGVQEYDVHNLFGHQILNATYQALVDIFPGKRPMIIGRSTFASSGRWAGHWGGDNTSLFANMYYSISQALSFALFGIPMFGADTCGFAENTSEELCNRWMQLSAFFPFYRNHNTLTAISQEAYIWASVTEASKIAMKIRYSLLPYIYTLFHSAHTRGDTVMRALAWEFPDDPTLAAVDNQFLLGPALMIAPALSQGQIEVQAVFPDVKKGTVWYDWYSQAPIVAQPGENVTFAAPLSHIPVFIRGGYILPQQEALYTTSECRNSSWSMIVALDSNKAAHGTIYSDDGESIVPSSTRIVTLTASHDSILACSQGEYMDTNSLANVTVLGVQSSPGKVEFNGATVTSGVSYNSTSKVLSVKGLQSVSNGSAWASDWQLTWS